MSEAQGVLAGGLLGFIIGVLLMVAWNLRRQIKWLTKQLNLKGLSKDAIREMKAALKDA